MRRNEREPVKSKGAYDLGQTNAQYAQRHDQWLAARLERDAYLLARDCSDPRLRRLDQLTAQLVRMLPRSASVVDLGFGPEGRDIADVLELGASQEVSVSGIELVPENVTSALNNPRFQQQGRNAMEGRLTQGDITRAIPFDDNSTDAVILSSVIQHIEPPTFYTKVAPGIARILKPNGILQLLFKRKQEDNSDSLTLPDPTMGGAQRSFYLYEQDKIVSRFQELGMELYEGTDEMIGGVLLWNDQKRPIPYAGMYLIKSPK